MISDRFSGDQFGRRRQRRAVAVLRGSVVRNAFGSLWPSRGRSHWPFLDSYNSPGAHHEVLHGLRAALPPNCRPIVVTDAGFRGPWFRQVQSYVWDWIGRVRNDIKFLNEATGRWCYSESLYAMATPKVKHLGERILGRRRGYLRRLYLVRAQLRVGRPPKRRRGIKPNETMYRRLHRAPWLLATSLPHQRGAEQRIKRLYEQRLQIEETLRDVKSHRIGMGLRYCRCNDAARLEVLLLIGLNNLGT